MTIPDPQALDAADPLARFRDRFVPVEPGLVYLDGNSLGRPTKASIERVAAITEAWGTRLIRGWDDGWLELPLVVGDQLATGVLGDAARAAGALVLWDLSHAAGSVPVNLAANGVDLAVGCTYKFLNGGPGAPAFLYVRHELQEELRPPIQGWFAQSEQFEMGPAFKPRRGIGGWLAGTPGIIGLTAAQAGIELVAEAGIDAIRTKGIALTEYAIALVDEWLVPLDCTLGAPRDAARRGNQLSIRHRGARRLTRALKERNVIPDFRAPDSIRIGLSPLTTSFEDVHRGLAALRELLA